MKRPINALIAISVVLPMAVVAQDKVETLPAQWGNPATPLTLDVSSPVEFKLIKPHDIKSKIYIKLTNIPPAYKGRYKPVVEYEKSTIPPLPSPSQFNQSQQAPPAAADGKADVQEMTEPTPSCSVRLGTLQSELYSDTLSSSQVPIILAKIKSVNTINDIENECANVQEALIKATEMDAVADVKNGSNLILSIIYTEGDKASTLAQITLEEEKKEWLVHAGWTFVDSKDRLHYSQAGEDGTYTIQEQNSQPSFNHALTVMYTYPFHKWSNDIYIGPSGMLGLSQNGLLVGGGISLGFTENLVANVSIVASEFDRLNGVYAIGQNVGEEPVDSTTLNTTQIKTSIAFTIGFRF